MACSRAGGAFLLLALAAEYRPESTHERCEWEMTDAPLGAISVRWNGLIEPMYLVPARVVPGAHKVFRLRNC